MLIITPVTLCRVAKAFMFDGDHVVAHAGGRTTSSSGSRDPQQYTGNVDRNMLPLNVAEND